VIEQSAIVVSNEAGIVEVEVVRQSSCHGCSAQSACGVSLLDRVLGRRPQRLVLTDALDVRPGDEVVVGVPEGALLKAAIVAYMIPLLGLLVGALVGEHLGADTSPSQTLPLLAGLCGLALGLVVTRIYSRRLASDPRWRAVLLRRVSRSLAVGLPEAR
jgi:sigma-E factor negative regulatory protein RseC